MKKLLCFLFIIFSFTATAQVPEPHMLWMKGIGGGGGDQINRAITKTADGGFIINFITSAVVNTGNIDSFCSFTNKRSIFLKYNADATIMEWNKCFGTAGDSGFNYFFPRENDKYVVAGSFGASVAGGWLISKKDGAGNTLWQRNHSKNNGSTFKDMISTTDGGYIMLGEANRADTNVLFHYGTWETFDFWIMKVDSNGYKVWSKVIGGTDDETAAALVAAPDNGFYVVGGTSSNDYDCIGNHGGSADAYVARFNDTGGIMWHRCLGGGDYDAATAACSNGKGGVIIAAKSMSTDGDVHNHKGQKDYWVTEIDSSGSIIWDNCYGSSVNFEEPLAVCKATDGSIWVNGYTYENREDVFLVHADSSGNLMQSLKLSSSQKDRGLMVHALPDGLVMVGGYFSLNNGSYSALSNFGLTDIFLSVYAPWPAAASNISVANTIRVYPNPVEKTLHIETAKTNKIHEVKMVDMAGRKVIYKRLETGMNTVDLDAENLSSGMYFVQIVDENGVRFIEKIEIK